MLLERRGPDGCDLEARRSPVVVNGRSPSTVKAMDEVVSPCRQEQICWQREPAGGYCVPLGSSVQGGQCPPVLPGGLGTRWGYAAVEMEEDTGTEVTGLVRRQVLPFAFPFPSTGHGKARVANAWGKHLLVEASVRLRMSTAVTLKPNTNNSFWVHIPQESDAACLKQTRAVHIEAVVLFRVQEVEERLTC